MMNKLNFPIRGLFGKDIFNNFELTTKHPDTIKEADKILKTLSVPNRKLSLKRDFIVNLIVNFKIARYTSSFLAVPRGKDIYTKIPKAYAPDYQTHDIVTQVLDELVDKGFISGRGYIKGAQMSGYSPLMEMLTPVVKLPFEEITTIKPKTFIYIRKNINGKNIDQKYKPTSTSKKLDLEIEKYNTLRETSKISFCNIPQNIVSDHNEIIRRYANVDVLSLKSMNGVLDISLRTTYLVRIFHKNLKNEGRFYR